jgi:ankyrin repeat protein
LGAVKLFLTNGADANSKNQEGWSPLHIAAAEGHFSVFDLIRNPDRNI